MLFFCSVSYFFPSALIFCDVPILLYISCSYLHSISHSLHLSTHPLAYFYHKHCNRCPCITLLQIHARISLVCIFPEISESEACTDIFTEFCQNAFQNTCTSLRYFSISLPNWYAPSFPIFANLLAVKLVYHFCFNFDISAY